MKCQECGTEFQGNFCPSCGRKAAMEEAEVTLDNKETNEYTKLSEESDMKATEEPSTESAKDIVKEGAMQYWIGRLKYIFLGAFLSAVWAFAVGETFAGIALAISGVLLMPPVIKKFTGNKRTILIVVAVLLVVIAVISANGSNNGSSVSSSGNGMVSYIGEGIEFRSESSGGTYVITFTDWGSTQDYRGNTITYLNYTVENNGNTAITFNSFLLDVYADGYAVDDGIPSGGANLLNVVDLSAGRKAQGTIYPDVDPDMVNRIEVEYGGVVWIIKNE